MIKAGIVGGTGYTGVELLRLLLQHSEVQITAITSRKEAGMPVAEMYPSLRGKLELAFTDPASALLADCDVVFFATPHGVAMDQAGALLDAGVRVIDLAADFRFDDLSVFERWYGMAHRAPELAAEAVYGLPEIYRDRIKKARLIGLPGCYPTAMQLGFAPLLMGDAPLVDETHLIANCASGVSGAGRKLELSSLFGEASDNYRAYGIKGHRHWPETEASLCRVAQRDVKLLFVPHLIPMIRGIHATLYARIVEGAMETDFQALYEARYQNEPFVDVMPAGSTPDTRSVRSSNMVRISVNRPSNGDTLVILVVEDNLVKGASGQAVQAMNLMFGLEETSGLSQLPVSP